MMLITVKVLRNNRLAFDGRYLVPVSDTCVYIFYIFTFINAAKKGKELTMYQVVQDF